MEVKYFDSLPSTNRAAAEAAREGAGEFYTVVAREQTAGRGRLDRSFFSPAGGIYMSVVLRPTVPQSEYPLITPMAAVAVQRAIANVTKVKTEIKWVNDLLLCGKKVCGILAESGTDQSGSPFVILGIGINAAPVDFPAELAESATFVPCEDKGALIGAILAELAEYERIIKENAWYDYYREHCAFLGEPVLVTRAGETEHAIALDVLSDGALRVLLEGDRIEDLRGGEISLRAAQID